MGSSKQSRFIESLLMNLPTHQFSCSNLNINRYEVMDGQQRLSSIVSFYENRLKLTGLEYWRELLGKCYSDLPRRSSVALIGEEFLLLCCSRMAGVETMTSCGVSYLRD